MKLKTKSVGLIAVVFFAVLGASYLLFGRMKDDVMSGLGKVYAEKQVLYNRARVLHPLMRELALAQKLAESSTLKAWARNESDPALRAAGLRELEEKNEKLQKTLAEISTLSGLLPTCSYCKKIRDQEGRWSTMENFISQRTTAKFSHGICPDCMARARTEMGSPPEPT